MGVTSIHITGVDYDAGTGSYTISGTYTSDGETSANSITLRAAGQVLNAGSPPGAVQNVAGGQAAQTPWSFTISGANLTSAQLADFSDGTATITASNNLVGGARVVVTANNMPVTCYMAGTLIATPSGEVKVEDLRPGDLVLTADGRAVPVRWVGRQTVSRVFAHPLHALPVRIRAGALGDGLPKRDLLVSPGHAMGLDGLLVEAAALVNGASILRDADVPAVFTYFHVELADHALILAEGAPSESFLDNVARTRFDNGADFVAAFGEPAIPELDLPRVTSARQLPLATRRRLAEAAARLAGGAAVAAA